MIKLNLPIRTVSELNERGMTRGAALKKACRKKGQRETVHWVWVASVKAPQALPCKVTLTRIAPRQLDSHDNLRASLKAVVDQLAVELGLPTNKRGHAEDADGRVTWEYGQRRGGVREYAVEVLIESVKESEQNVPRETLPKEAN